MRGGNYGWRCFEGTQMFRAVDDGRNLREPENLRPPIAEYAHSLGAAVTGGYVYRGTAIPALVGRYVFGDFASGRIWDIPNDTQPTMTMTGGLESGLNISSFGEDHDGELYVVNMRADLHRITARGWRRRGRGHATLRHRLRERVESDAARERAHSLRAERAVLVRRRSEGALDRHCRTDRTSPSAPTATGISRTARC